MRYLFVLIFTISVLHSFAQTADTSFQSVTLYTALNTSLPLTKLSFTEKAYHQLMVGGSGMYNSSFVDVAFVNSVVSNKFLDVTTKDRQLKRMIDRGNKVMYAFDYGIQYTWKKDSSLFTHQISVSDRSITTAELSKDTYRFLMYGNGPEPGMLSFKYNELYDVRFRQFSYGLFYRPLSGLIVYGSVGLLQGLRYHHAYFTSSYFETGEYGDKIDMNYRLSYAGIDKPVQPWSIHYTGFTLNGGALFSNNPTKYQVWVGFRDMSSINTRFYTKLYSGAAKVTFEGLEVSNLFNITDTTFNNIDTDSLLRYFNINRLNARVTDALPFTIRLGCKYLIGNSFVLQIESEFYTSWIQFYPMVTFTAGKKIKNMEASFISTVGGFKQPHFGVQLLYETPKQLCFFVKSTALEALVLPRHSTAINLALAAAYQF